MVIDYYKKQSNLREKKILNTIRNSNSIVFLYFDLFFMFGLNFRKIKYYLLVYKLNYQNINTLIYKYPKNDKRIFDECKIYLEKQKIKILNYFGYYICFSKNIFYICYNIKDLINFTNEQKIK